MPFLYVYLKKHTLLSPSIDLLASCLECQSPLLGATLQKTEVNQGSHQLKVAALILINTWLNFQYLVPSEMSLYFHQMKPGFFKSQFVGPVSRVSHVSYVNYISYISYIS